jgi:hypothetical protein
MNRSFNTATVYIRELVAKALVMCFIQTAMDRRAWSSLIPGWYTSFVVVVVSTPAGAGAHTVVILSHLQLCLSFIVEWLVFCALRWQSHVGMY